MYVVLRLFLQHRILADTDNGPDPAWRKVKSPSSAPPEVVILRLKVLRTGVCLTFCLIPCNKQALILLSRLLKASREAVKPNSTKWDNIIAELLREHLAAMQLRSPELAQNLEREMTTECDNLTAYLTALPKTGVVAPESEDKILSVGEKLSAQLVATLLKDRGIDSEYVDLSDVINFRPVHGLNQVFYHDLARAIGRRIQLCGDRVPIITGFFGPVPGGLLDTCGRGYSDLCAALVAVGLGAKELQVWKEVSGVYTAWVYHAHRSQSSSEY